MPNEQVLICDINQEWSASIGDYLAKTGFTPSLRVFLVFESQMQFEESELTPNAIIKLGVTKYFIKPMGHQKITSALKGGQKFDTWKENTDSNDDFTPEEMEINDKEFTRIKIKSFAMGARTVFDHYNKEIEEGLAHLEDLSNENKEKTIVRKTNINGKTKL